MAAIEGPVRDGRRKGEALALPGDERARGGGKATPLLFDM
jgi:hypothetical protein